MTPFVVTTPKLQRPGRQVLSPDYIRRLIERHYTCSYNYFHYISIKNMTSFLQRTYSPNITYDMVEEALEIEPTIQFRGKINCHFLMYA
jgi:hypothetical protein